MAEAEEAVEAGGVRVGAGVPHKAREEAAAAGVTPKKGLPTMGTPSGTPTEGLRCTVGREGAQRGVKVVVEGGRVADPRTEALVVGVAAAAGVLPAREIRGRTNKGRSRHRCTKLCSSSSDRVDPAEPTGVGEAQRKGPLRTPPPLLPLLRLILHPFLRNQHLLRGMWLAAVALGAMVNPPR